MIIIVTGTPATGKTTLSKKISEKFRLEYLDLKKVIKENKLYDSFDKKRECYVVDTNKLNKFLIEKIKKSKKNIIIDSLLSHYLPKKYTDLCIITKCNLKELKKRLEKRRYSKEKVRENLDSEIFDICLNEAKEAGHYTFVINTTKSIKKEAFNQLIGEINAIKRTGRRSK
jgi:adenylate kinase